MSINLTSTFVRDRFPVRAGTVVQQDGTWRAAFRDVTGNDFTMTDVQAAFRLNHDVCHFQGRITWSDIGAAVGTQNVLFQLPFAAKVAANNWGVTRQSSSIGYLPSTDFQVNAFINHRIEAGESLARMVTTRNVSGGIVLDVADMDPSSGQFDFHGTYIIALPGDQPTPIN